MRDTGAVREDLANGDVLLAVPFEARNVIRHAVIDIEVAELGELVNQHPGDCFCAREEVDRCVDAHRHRVNTAAAGLIAPRMPDGAIQHDASAVQHD